MAIVKPFLCVRPRPDIAARVAALPYDVYSRGGGEARGGAEPLSFLRIDRLRPSFPTAWIHTRTAFTRRPGSCSRA